MYNTFSNIKLLKLKSGKRSGLITICHRGSHVGNKQKYTYGEITGPQKSKETEGLIKAGSTISLSTECKHSQRHHNIKYHNYLRND